LPYVIFNNNDPYRPNLHEKDIEITPSVISKNRCKKKNKEGKSKGYIYIFYAFHRI